MSLQKDLLGIVLVVDDLVVRLFKIKSNKVFRSLYL